MGWPAGAGRSPRSPGRCRPPGLPSPPPGPALPPRSCARTVARTCVPYCRTRRCTIATASSSSVTPGWHPSLAKPHSTWVSSPGWKSSMVSITTCATPNRGKRRCHMRTPRRVTVGGASGISGGRERKGGPRGWRGPRRQTRCRARRVAARAWHRSVTGLQRVCSLTRASTQRQAGPGPRSLRASKAHSWERFARSSEPVRSDPGFHAW